MAEFKLGNYTFETEEAYNAAQREVSLIRQIKEKYDLSDPKVLDALAGKFKAQTAIGRDFMNTIEKRRMEARDAAFFKEMDSELQAAPATEIPSGDGIPPVPVPPPSENVNVQSTSGERFLGTLIGLDIVLYLCSICFPALYGEPILWTFAYYIYRRRGTLRTVMLVLLIGYFAINLLSLLI